MSEQQHHEYDAAELAAIMERAEAGDLTGTIVAAFNPFGVDLLNPDGPLVSCTDYAIPSEQWKAICGALSGNQRKRVGDISAVNLAMDWMNVGPSSYD